MACLTTGDMIFRGVLIFILLFLIIFLAWNIFEFNKLRVTPASGITSTQAIAAMVISVIFIFIAFLLIIWIAVSWFWCTSVVPAIVATPPIVPQAIEMREIPYRAPLGPGIRRTTTEESVMPQPVLAQPVVARDVKFYPQAVPAPAPAVYSNPPAVYSNGPAVYSNGPVVYSNPPAVYSNPVYA